MEGRRIPAVTFKCRVDGEWTDVTTKDIFKRLFRAQHKR